MKKLYQMYIDYGRMGSLDGLFISTDEEMNNLYGKEVYFGEVLGKHSEVIIDMEKDYFKVISDDQEKIEWLESLLGSSVSGFCPFDYIEDYDDDDDDD